MKIVSVHFVKSATLPEHYPVTNLPEVAFLGRSNVGKSSCINSLLNRKKLVKTSSTPGKTQLINFFCVNDNIMFVDLPGYGYAKVPKQIKDGWQKMIETYLSSRKQLKGIILLIDSRREPTLNDKIMLNFLNHITLNTIIVASKADKLPKSKKKIQGQTISKALSNDSNIPCILFSKNTGEGKKDILNIIKKWIS